MSTMEKKRDVKELDFFEHMLLACEMSEIHAEYSQSIIDLAVKYDVDALGLYKAANKALTSAEDDPEFIEKILPILIDTAKMNKTDEE